MEILEKTWKTTGALHHAYFLVGDISETAKKLTSFLENTVGIKIAGNPDFWRRQFNVFTVDEARDLSDSQERRSFTADQSNRAKFAMGLKIFIIEANSITEQAQNALLKIFEEPTAHTHFFILMPQDVLLPTFRSRIQVIIEVADGDHLQKQSADGDHLQKSLLERMGVVKKIVDGIKDEKSTKQDAISLLNQIEREIYDKQSCRRFFHQKNRVEKNVSCKREHFFNGDHTECKKWTNDLKVCQLARESLNDNGAPVKMILENFMLSI